jgi:hypothetical protein
LMEAIERRIPTHEGDAMQHWLNQRKHRPVHVVDRRGEK